MGKGEEWQRREDRRGSWHGMTCSREKRGAKGCEHRPCAAQKRQRGCGQQRVRRGPREWGAARELTALKALDGKTENKGKDLSTCLSNSQNSVLFRDGNP